MELIYIFAEVHDFCKQIEGKAITDQKTMKCIKERSLHISEIMTICILFSESKITTFKDFYRMVVQEKLKNEFPSAPSYGRFVELRGEAVTMMMLFSLIKNAAKLTNGTAFIDSFHIKACHNKREFSHKTLKGLAKKGKTTIGYFYGFKLHIVINLKGEICAFLITPGNVADNNESLLKFITKNIFGKLFGDKGYIVNPKLYRELFEQGTQLITKIKKNMKNKLYNAYDYYMLNKRSLIESVGNILKNILHIEHTRHRSINGFFMHIFSTLAAYAFKDKKPSIFNEKMSLA